MKIKYSELDRIINELVRAHGVLNVIKSVIASCDTSADFHHLANNKKIEEYWRRAAVAIFDSIKCIGDYPEKSKKFETNKH